MKPRMVDTGNIIVRLGGKCQICGRRSDTIVISNIEVCGSCAYQILSKEIKEREDERTERVMRAAANIFSESQHGILAKIIKTRSVVKIASKILLKI